MRDLQERKNLTFVAWLKLLIGAARLRLGQIVVFAIAFLEVAYEYLLNLKSYLVSRMFWGRGSLYKNSFHILITLISGGLLVTGLLSHVGVVRAGTAALEIAYGTFGNNDLLTQGASITSVFALSPGQGDYRIFRHIVEQGETIASIATRYGVDEATIIWANDDVINPFNPSISVGIELEIPEVRGVLYTVEAGQTLDSILAEIKGADLFTLVELNNLIPPDYRLQAGQKLFIPHGELAPPDLPGLSKEYFANPLSHPRCAGYRFIRGLSSYHSGVDLAKGGGCPIRSVAAGIVDFAGWYGSGGYTVIIDHGSGIKSYYLHGNGEIWVKSGDFVRKGQDIMYMGCTGNCTGTHLHLSLRRSGVLVNPARYIPY